MPVSARLDHELIDFGHGRKLERFGEVVVDRPAPGTAAIEPTSPECWSAADARYEAKRAAAGRWFTSAGRNWTVSAGELCFELRLSESGQVGLFPEQAANWGWLQQHCADAAVQVLNLFAYSGASTLAAAAAGARVVHVDAAGSSVQWARRNAELSALSGSPIRWIVEDARKFVARELRRGNRYEGIILDPPSYGHGPGGEAWKFADHFEALLSDCCGLLSAHARFVLLTCHTTGWRGSELAEDLGRRLHSGRIEWGEMALSTVDGRRLECGAWSRWTNS
jgi:23S rRNA (cytosine1962-C5)-methyltransferase